MMRLSRACRSLNATTKAGGGPRRGHAHPRWPQVRSSQGSGRSLRAARAGATSNDTRWGSRGRKESGDRERAPDFWDGQGGRGLSSSSLSSSSWSSLYLSPSFVAVFIVCASREKKTTLRRPFSPPVFRTRSSLASLVLAAA